MARLGHALTLTTTRWSATLDVGDEPAACSVVMTSDLTSLKVLDSRGGAAPAGPDDAAKIVQNARKGLHVTTYPTLSFRSSAVSGTWEQGTLTGDLTLNGVTRSYKFTVVGDGKTYTLTGELYQTDFDIKPFTTMMGALRLADTVGIEVRVSL